MLSQISDHFPQFLVIINTTVYYRHRTLFQYDYSKFVESSFINDFTGLSWDFLNETTLNINSKFDTLYEKVHETACVPLKKSPPKQLKLRSKPWIDFHIPGFSLGCICMGGGEFVPPPYGGTSAVGQSVTGGIHEGRHRPVGGPNFDRLYHKLKVLLLLSCNYTMQLIGYDFIKTH